MVASEQSLREQNSAFPLKIFSYTLMAYFHRVFLCCPEYLLKMVCRVPSHRTEFSLDPYQKGPSPQAVPLGAEGRE